jgi:N-methylhydantoinase B
VDWANNQTSVLIEDRESSDKPIRVQVAVTINVGHLKTDFSRTSKQRDNGLNCPTSSTISMAHYAVKADFAPRLPQKEGCKRHIDICVPQGCLLDPKYPAVVSVRHLTQQAVADAAIKPLAPLVPTEASAGVHVSFPTFCAGGVDDRKNRCNPALPLAY